MDDREIQQLIRMAIEVEDLDASRDVAGRIGGPAPVLPVVGIHHGMHWRRWTAAGLTAAAACLALAFWWPRPVGPTAPPITGPIATAPAPHPPAEPVAPSTPVVRGVRYVSAPGEQCVVLSIFLGSGGSCRCLQWRTHQWEPGRTLADICPSELLDLAFKSSCTANPEHVLVLAISGPPGTLPKTRADAEAILACVNRANLGADQDPSAYASAAMACLPSGAKAVAETQTLAMAK